MRFLTRARLTGYSRVLVAFYVVFWIGWFVTGTGLLGLHEGPAGSDFLAIYAGAKLTTGNDPAAAYDYIRLLAAARETVGGNIKIGPWMYPPVFATIVAPFTYVPYLVAAPLWLMLTGAAFLHAVRRTSTDGLAPWLALASLAAFDNAMGGQNGFLSAALLGFGLLGLRTNPMLGGLVLGCMVYKPQLAGFAPLVLLLAGQWRAVLGFAAGALAISALSLFVVGWEGWLAFFAGIPEAKNMLEVGGPNWFKMPTVFVAARLVGADVAVAQVLHASVAVVTLAAVVWVWRRPAPFTMRAAALGIGSLLISPFVHYYDWTLLAIPVAWLARDMAPRDVAPWQLWTFVAAFFFPLFAPSIAAFTNLQLGPLVTLAMLAVVVERVRDASRDPG